MSDPEIIALARECAEKYTKKKYPNAPGHVRERIVEGRLEHMEDFIPWLLRRYCLVEKSKVVAEYKNVAKAVKAKREYNLTLSEDKLAKADLLFDLFPEIAKEVES